MTLFGTLLCVAALLNTNLAAKAGLRPVVSAPYIVVDVESGKIFARNKVFLRWAPASLTKMMTAYTVFRTLELQHLAMNSPVRISEAALAQPPSKMGFPIGTILTIEAALKIIMVKSANDISVALGEAVGGSEAQFVKLMNIHARRLGMVDTQFINPHGLHDPEQFTTARDMAILAIALSREFPEYANFFDIPALRVVGRRLRNHNALLRLFAGTTGMKTGYVCASGYNVVVRTKRNDRNLVAVVLGHTSGFRRSVAAAELLSDAFEQNGKAFRPMVDTILRPESVSVEPVDITRRMCPGKYAARAVPNIRPVEAPASQDFDGIDTQVLEQRAEAAANPLRNLPLPTKRPFHKFVDVSAGSIKSDSEPDAAKSKPVEQKSKVPSLKERAKKHLQPRKDLRADVKVALGGAVGPNPFKVQHTNGGIYKPGIPIPQKRPALDSKQSQE